VKLRSTIVLGAVLAAGAAGIGHAAIPSADGVVSACKKSDGSIKLIDKESGQSCGASQKLVEWSRQGPPGPVGPQGPAGPSDPIAAGFVDRFGTDTGGAAAANGAPCTLGEVKLTASTVKTAGGLPANGQLMPVSGNEALFQLLGTTYGGDGGSTFALPDLRAVAPKHMTYSICVDGIWPAS
jgi:Phage Tail Collar Domain